MLYMVDEMLNVCEAALPIAPSLAVKVART
jgi:hypothetical protein